MSNVNNAQVSSVSSRVDDNSRQCRTTLSTGIMNFNAYTLVPYRCFVDNFSGNCQETRVSRYAINRGCVDYRF